MELVGVVERMADCNLVLVEQAGSLQNLIQKMHVMMTDQLDRGREQLVPCDNLLLELVVDDMSVHFLLMKVHCLMRMMNFHCLRMMILRNLMNYNQLVLVGQVLVGQVLVERVEGMKLVEVEVLGLKYCLMS